MPNLCITQFVGAMPGHGDGYVINVPKGPLASESIAIGASSTQSDPFEDACTLLLVFAEADCFVAIGVDPDAETGHQIAMAANTTAHFGVEPGHRVAVVERTVS
jgi:hypothetical protein